MEVKMKRTTASIKLFLSILVYGIIGCNQISRVEEFDFESATELQENDSIEDSISTSADSATTVAWDTEAAESTVTTESTETTESTDTDSDSETDSSNNIDTSTLDTLLTCDITSCAGDKFCDATGNVACQNECGINIELEQCDHTELLSATCQLICDNWCNPNEIPHSTGVFVSPDGDDETAGAGSKKKPFKTITKALNVAHPGLSIYLNTGEYEETLTINSAATDIAIIGGWMVNEGQWIRNCNDTAKEETQIIQLRDDTLPCIGLTIQNAKITLDTLTVSTLERGIIREGKNTDSCYGIWIGGELSQVTLKNVIVEAGDGADGGVFYAAPPEIPDCSITTLDSNCQDGANGVSGITGEDAYDGVFSANGFQPGNGEPGEPGQPGASGLPGNPGQSNSCITGCSTGSCYQYGCACKVSNTITQNATGGKCGCGGVGGAGGTGGGGGGASVALLVTDENARLDIQHSKLIVGNGGNGNYRSKGLSGANGELGIEGSNTTCLKNCPSSVPHDETCVASTTSLLGGAAGGPGGNGGTGAAGGGGAGGPSVGLAYPKENSIHIDNSTVIILGEGGEGNSLAPSGKAEEIVTF